eukprot:gene20439-27228_t
MYCARSPVQVNVLSAREAAAFCPALGKNLLPVDDEDPPQGGVAKVYEVMLWGPWASEALASGIRDGSETITFFNCTAEGGGRPASSYVAAPLVSFARRLAGAAWLRDQANSQVETNECRTAVQLLQQAQAAIDAKPSGNDASVGASQASGSGSESVLSRALASLLPSIGLGPSHILRCRVLASLMKAAIDERDSWQVALAAARAAMDEGDSWQVALAAARAAMDEGDSWQVALAAARALAPVYELAYPSALAPVYELAYPSVWPNLGLHYAALAKLEMFLEKPDRAFMAAQKAVASLSVTHGHYHGTSGGALAEVVRVVQEAQREAAHLGFTLK